MSPAPYAVALLAFSSTPVLADPPATPCTQAPRSEWMSDEKLLTAVRQQGYKLKRFDMERNCAEVEGWNAQGARVELRLDPTSARVVSCKYKSLLSG
jgi:hypothetical protein